MLQYTTHLFITAATVFYKVCHIECIVLYMAALSAAIQLPYSNPTKAKMDYFRSGISQTDYIGNKYLIYIF
jgi:hypothetical protein